jgi:hypothetical protein
VDFADEQTGLEQLEPFRRPHRRLDLVGTLRDEGRATVRCANAGMNIEAVALVTELNGSLSGTWEEKVYNSSGTLSGTGDASGLLMKIAGAYSATLTIKIVGSERQIVLTPQGGVVKSLNVRLAKAD